MNVLMLWILALLLLPAAIALPGCGTAPATPPAGCRVYRPHVAKSTFDGRVGHVVILNASPRAAEVKIYHPDGTGDVELRWMVPAGTVLTLTGPDSQRLPLGNDWGIQVDRSCVATLGRVAAWDASEFSLHWGHDSLRAGLDPPRRTGTR